VRVAVVGAGGWGEQHARIFSRRSDTELVAIVGRNTERTATRASTYSTAPYVDIDAMLDAQAPDLVTVCLPNEGHFGPTLHLLERGVPLLVEKPLVFDLDEADALLRAAADRKLFFAINFNHRFAEPILRAKAAIDAGEIGNPVFATWRFGGEANHGTSRHANLIETQCHGFDMLEHLVGPIASISSHMTDMTYGDWSTVAMSLTFESGAVGTMLGSYDSSYSFPETQRIEVNGTTGRLIARDTVRELVIQSAGDPIERRWSSGYFDDESRAFHSTFDRHVDVILEAFRRGAEPPIHARAGRRALQLALAAIESFETGRTVAVPG